MPLLIVVRHAKAEAPRPELSDHDRALTLDGRTAATTLGQRLAEAGWVPDVALVSSANRAQQTWKLMSASLPDAQAVTVPELYESGIGAYQSALAGQTSEVVATVAHEPTASGFAAFLSGAGSDKKALQSIALGLVTSGAAVIEVPSWDRLDRGAGRLVAVLTGR